jgi:hypothetical protein
MEDPVDLPCAHRLFFFCRTAMPCRWKNGKELTMMVVSVVLSHQLGGTTIDRVTIERSLLDNEINPFSREPMTVDDLVSNGAWRQWSQCFSSQCSMTLVF